MYVVISFMLYSYQVPWIPPLLDIELFVDFAVSDLLFVMKWFTLTSPFLFNMFLFNDFFSYG